MDPSQQQLELIAAHERRNTGRPATEFVLRDGIEFKITPDSQEPFSAFTFSQPEMVVEMDGFLQATRDCRRLLDIGALHGVFSLAFCSRTGAEAVAVDPSPLAFPRLLYNVYANPHCNIRTVEVALSDSTGTLPMHFEWQHAVAGELSGGQAVNVQATTGDALLAELSFAPDAIKIDVEGHEVQVLEGLRRTIARCRPRIFLEVHPSRIRSNGKEPGDLLAVFQKLHYDARDLRGELVAELDLNHDLRLILTPQ